MIFFQAMLLAGYIYAHLLTTKFSLLTQIIIHLLIMVMALIFLPIAISNSIDTPSENWPTVWLLWLFMSSIGLPFFIVSANAPLLQSWFSTTRDTHAHDPYFLYAASNVGSIAALAAYPLYIEIQFGLVTQGVLWSGGFITLLGLILFCGLFLKINASPLASNTEQATVLGEAKAPSISNYAHWIFLALVPSALLLSITNKITTDLLAIPLLWVIPLGLYLLTFVIVFSRNPIISHSAVSKIAPYLLIAVAVVTISTPGTNTILMFIAGSLFCFFFIALYCHSKLASLRPRASFLTNFYIAMSFGGVLGGIFVGIVAPTIFNNIYEYALLLIFAALLMPKMDKPAISIINRLLGKKSQSVAADILLPLTILGLSWIVDQVQTDTTVIVKLITVIASTLIILLLVEGIGRPIRFSLSIVAAVIISGQFGDLSKKHFFNERSFFGVYTVQKGPSDSEIDQKVRIATHGTTVHGIQFKDSIELVSYYHLQGGLGILMNAFEENNLRPKNIGAIGLGTGTALCYQSPGQEWTFYEIDPLVERLARDPSQFTFLSECGPLKDVIIGDARLSLKEVKEKEFDLLIADAFSSDSIPIHLLTKEAFDLYRDKIQDDGIIILHISNRYFDLEQVIAATAGASGLKARVYHYVRGKDPTIDKPYHLSTSWVALARSETLLDQVLPIPLPDSSEKKNSWRRLTIDPDIKVWTDDYSHVLSTLK
ncbi:spermidine synthase [Kiloniella sp.]|uniref:spermidine synthase n=1 Tax=Kiloniella sp. TaxID=1938587 RepID=UPI003B01861C